MRVFGRVTSKNCQTMMISIDMLVHDLTIYFIYIILFKKWQANTRLTANVFLEIEWTAGVINLSKDIVAPAALLALQCGEQASNCKARKKEKGSKKRVLKTHPSISTLVIPPCTKSFENDIRRPKTFTRVWVSLIFYAAVAK